ncbi:hypothetical protein H6G97_45655 [Nostoc flagelliforme FACHB-838]|uniref:Uncharacterized protein n=1 Tax=Nostoc flagelliforme FACHB-838 TaxID=2692904 RepID=A0ABR8E6E9_9NOSO|nr:hypothetical protein [Nostoc flagelliforme]MBD2536203.1 hypothetical protein [Nostoc flagelliforme FACHB-838]
MKINWKTGIIALATFATLTPMSSVLAQEINKKSTFEPVDMISSSTSSNDVTNLDGTWDYQVSLPASQCYVLGGCAIKIVGSIAYYVLPVPTGSGASVVNVYSTTTNRGKPVVTIGGVGITGQDITYAIVLSGRLDQPGLITGSLVDVDNNQGTFTLKKRP